MHQKCTKSIEKVQRGIPNSNANTTDPNPNPKDRQEPHSQDLRCYLHTMPSVFHIRCFTSIGLMSIFGFLELIQCPKSSTKPIWHTENMQVFWYCTFAPDLTPSPEITLQLCNYVGLYPNMQFATVPTGEVLFPSMW